MVVVVVRSGSRYLDIYLSRITITSMARERGHVLRECSSVAPTVSCAAVTKFEIGVP